MKFKLALIFVIIFSLLGSMNVSAQEGCTYDWNCSEWEPNKCGPESFQIRNCNNLGTCKEEGLKPLEIRNCTYETKKLLPSQLFDISFEIDNNVLKKKDDLSGKINFKNFGANSTEIYLTFIIFNELGNEIYQEEESLLVEAEEILFKNFEDLNLPEGKYEIVLRTLYGLDIENEFRHGFEVKSNEKGYFILIVILVILLFFVKYWFKKREKK